MLCEVLVSFAPHVPLQEREPLVRMVMETYNDDGDPLSRGLVLASLLPLFSGEDQDPLLRRTMALANRVLPLDQRARLLIALLPFLSEGERHQMLQVCRADAEGRPAVLARLVPYLPETSRQALLPSLCRACMLDEYTWEQAQILALMAPFLPEPDLQNLMNRLLTLAEQAGELSRSEAVAYLAEHLPRAERWALASSSLLGLAHVEEPWKRIPPMEALARSLSSMPRPGLYQLWQDVLPILASTTRANLLASLGALSPIILTLNGEIGAAEAFRSIRDVSSWWP